jgi:hypothetical protein
VITLFASAISSGNWWILFAMALRLPQPETVPLPIWLAAQGVGLYVLPWPTRVALILLVVTGVATLWLRVQFRRSDAGDPTFDLKRLRHDTRTSHRALVEGGPQ